MLPVFILCLNSGDLWESLCLRPETYEASPPGLFFHDCGQAEAQLSFGWSNWSIIWSAYAKTLGPFFSACSPVVLRGSLWFQIFAGAHPTWQLLSLTDVSTEFGERGHDSMARVREIWVCSPVLFGGINISEWEGLLSIILTK